MGLSVVARVVDSSTIERTPSNRPRLKCSIASFIKSTTWYTTTLNNSSSPSSDHSSALSMDRSSLSATSTFSQSSEPKFIFKFLRQCVNRWLKCTNAAPYKTSSLAYAQGSLQSSYASLCTVCISSTLKMVIRGNRGCSRSRPNKHHRMSARS